VKRRELLASLSAFPLLARSVPARESRPETPGGIPWPHGVLLEPAALAERLRDPANSPTVISVVFPVLYRQKHIAGAKFAGPTSRPEGISALKLAVSPLSKNTFIVLYCGCCPMVHCPNIHPAFETLRDLGYINVRVLDLPNNFRTDWQDKGFPVEPRS
jgi:hypothetical protein